MQFSFSDQCFNVKRSMFQMLVLCLMQCSAEDEKESSSSEDDDDDRRRLNDDLLGKVACVQSGSDSDSWHYVLVRP